MAIKKIKKSVELIAEENTTVSKRNGKEVEVVKQGIPLDHAVKQNLLSPLEQTVGLSKGVTVNMGDYQSARVDCWVTTTIEEGETVQQALSRLAEIIDTRIEVEMSKVD